MDVRASQQDFDPHLSVAAARPAARQLEPSDVLLLGEVVEPKPEPAPARMTPA